MFYPSNVICVFSLIVNYISSLNTINSRAMSTILLTWGDVFLYQRMCFTLKQCFFIFYLGKTINVSFGSMFATICLNLWQRIICALVTIKYQSSKHSSTFTEIDDCFVYVIFFLYLHSIFPFFTHVEILSLSLSLGKTVFSHKEQSFRTPPMRVVAECTAHFYIS